MTKAYALLYYLWLLTSISPQAKLMPRGLDAEHVGGCQEDACMPLAWVQMFA